MPVTGLFSYSSVKVEMILVSCRFALRTEKESCFTRTVRRACISFHVCYCNKYLQKLSSLENIRYEIYYNFTKYQASNCAKSELNFKLIQLDDY